VSFDLAVFAADPGADEASVRTLIDRCRADRDHDEGELDERIVRFYETLRSIYPDHPPYDWDACPWMSMPLDVGIDHVFMNLSWSANHEVIRAIERLVAAHSLVLYDQQDGTIYLPAA
jgi:hypothetical protein